MQKNGLNQSKPNSTNDLAVLLNLASELYHVPAMQLPPKDEVNIPSLIRTAEKNQMGFFFAQKILVMYQKNLSENNRLILNNVIETHKSKYAQMQQALASVDAVLTDYMVIKSHYGFPRVGADIDIYTHDFEKTRQIFAANNFEQIEAKGQKAMFLVNGFKIHLHRNVSWANETTTFIDDNLIWANSRRVKLGEVEVRVPNENADLLMHLAHITYECFHITLANIFHILRNSSNVDWAIMSDQAQKHNWNGAMKASIQLLDKYHHTFYSCECPFSGLDVKHLRFESSKPVSIPLPIPRMSLVHAIMEKGLFTWAISKRTLMSARTMLSKD